MVRALLVKSRMGWLQYEDRIHNVTDTGCPTQNGSTHDAPSNSFKGGVAKHADSQITDQMTD